MTWTRVTLNLLDASGNPQPIICYTDGTNFSFAHPLLDSGGNIFDPAVVTGAVNLPNTPTVTSGSAYVSGYVVGGIINLTGAVRVNGGSGIIQSVGIITPAGVSVPYDVLFFNASPTGGGLTDHAALNIAAADATKIIPCPAHCTDFWNLGATEQAAFATNLAAPFQNQASNTSIYAAIVARGAPTFTSTTDVKLLVEVLQN